MVGRAAGQIYHIVEKRHQHFHFVSGDNNRHTASRELSEKMLPEVFRATSTPGFRSSGSIDTVIV